MSGFFAKEKEVSGMKYFTSDLHFGHENVLRLCNRPFSCVEEMDEHLIQEWNKLVHRNDEVYILGDFSFRAEKPPEYYLDRLKGEKHLIIGNHDKSWMKKVDLDKYFKSVQWMTLVNTGKGNATLCHFPVLDGEGKFMIHGHIHAKGELLEFWQYLKNTENMLNAGVDVNGYKPVLIEELIENNIRFKQEH